MKRGKYCRPRQRLNPYFVILVVALIAVAVLLVTILLGRAKPDPDPQPAMSTPAATQSTTNATTAPSTAPITIPTTAPTTAPTTEATTEPTTAPTTEDPTEDPTEPPAPDPSSVGAQVAELALQQIGKGYLYGGVGPDSFDTSGLIVYCYAECGVEVPRTTSTQVDAGVAVPRDALEPGDVIFFWLETPGTAEYEAIYVGDGKIVAARHGDNPVTEMELSNEYYSEHYLCARRYYKVSN